LGRPLHREGARTHGGRIEIAAEREGGDDLAAGQAEIAERHHLALGRRQPQLLGKLAPRGGEQRFAVLDQPLGDRPRAGILLRPERAAGMEQQYLRLGVGQAVEGDAGGVERFSLKINQILLDELRSTANCDCVLPSGSCEGPMNIIKTNVAQYGLTKLIQRLGRDCAPTQFLREFTMNSVEAIQRTQKPGKVQVDVNWDMYRTKSLYKICFIDNGDGMTADEMREHLNNLSSSGAEKNTFENYGMGAKIAALTRNHAGIVYDSWKGGIGSRIVIGYDEEERAYGIRPFLREDGLAEWSLPLTTDQKPELIETHGTRVTLMGMSAEEDTMLPPADAKGGRENWIYQYLNTRFYSLPSDIELQARIGYYREPDNVKHNYTRRVWGQKSTLGDYATHSGVVSLSDAKVYWWILRPDRSGHGRELIIGHTGSINQNEVFDVGTGRANRSAGFGIIFGKEDVVLYVEPKGGFVQDTTRTRLVQSDGSTLPWDRWQDEFRQLMPAELDRFMKERMGSAENKSHGETIRDRLKAISQFFKLSRYKRASTGRPVGDPTTETKSRVGSGTGETDGGTGTYRRLGDAKAAGLLEALLLSGVKDGGVVVTEITPDKFPEVRWVSVADGTRASEDLDDRAAEYLERDNLIRANADFQGFVDVVKHFAEQYGDVPGAENLIRDEVQEVFEQQLIEVVAGALAFRNRPRWSPEEFKQALSEEALTAACMCRYHLVAQIKRGIAAKIGKASKAPAEAEAS
jgi:hypothetical protein